MDLETPVSKVGLKSGIFVCHKVDHLSKKPSIADVIRISHHQNNFHHFKIDIFASFISNGIWADIFFVI